MQFRCKKYLDLLLLYFSLFMCFNIGASGVKGKKWAQMLWERQATSKNALFKFTKATKAEI